MRPIILGMNNPKSGDPDKVLLPTDEPGSAGNRLWSMSGRTEAEYLLAFERRNLLSILSWDRASATVAASNFLSTIQDGQVVIGLGKEVWQALIRAGLLQKKMRRERGIRFYFIAHPSGKNLHYNDPKNRAEVRSLLRRLHFNRAAP